MKKGNLLRNRKQKKVENKPVEITYPAKVEWKGEIVGEMQKNGNIEFFDYKTGLNLSTVMEDKAYKTINIDDKGYFIDYYRIVTADEEKEVIQRKKENQNSIFKKNEKQEILDTLNRKDKNKPNSLRNQIIYKFDV